MSFKSYRNQDYETIKSQLLRNGRLFEDSEFPASDYSVYRCPNMHHKFPPNYRIQWKRPIELVHNPNFIEGDIAIRDINQGLLGDCWFLAGVICVSDRKKYIEVNVPKDQSFHRDYCGLFHFRFWHDGEWYDVVVDDRLPYANGQLLFSRNNLHANEFWICLLEKAYAKLAGCYQFLIGGFTQEAFVDLTGGISEMIKIKHANLGLEFWRYLIEAYDMGSLIGGTVYEEGLPRGENCLPNGLVSGHAYAVTKVIEVTPENKHYKELLNSVSDIIEDFLNQTEDDAVGSLGYDDGYRYGRESPSSGESFKLLRLKNPWGNAQEWNGAFSDKSEQWQKIDSDVKKELGLVYEQDGEFWMPFKDFIKNFYRVEFVHLNTDAFSNETDFAGIGCKKSKWKCTQYNGEWEQSLSAGGSTGSAFWTNPQYFVRVDQTESDGKAQLIVSLLLKDAVAFRQFHNGEYAPLSKKVYLYRVDESIRDASYYTTFRPDQLQPVDETEFYELRELTKRFRVDPGSYVIIPCLNDRNFSAKFLLRLYTQVSVKCKDLDNKSNDNYNYDESYNNMNPYIDDYGREVNPEDFSNRGYLDYLLNDSDDGATGSNNDNNIDLSDYFNKYKSSKNKEFGDKEFDGCKQM